MNRQKIIARMTLLLLLAVFCFGTATAEKTDTAGGRVVVWKVTEPEIDIDILLDETFNRGTENEWTDIREEKREFNGRFWDTKSEEGPPFCGVESWWGTGYLLSFDIYRQADYYGKYKYYYDIGTQNTIPEESGFGAERAAETIARSEDLLKRLGLYGESYQPSPVSFTTCGRIKGTTKSRKVLFEELLDGLPVRWSQDSLYDNARGKDPTAYYLYTELAWSDEEGLLKMDAYWSGFEPLTRAENTLSAEEAAARFAEAGLKEQQPEACWFLSGNGKEATATLAWRVEHTFLSAVDGVWLQTQ
ncbi:hypothetical protein [Aristaeella hokkaidonensis]|uniref:Uncharacterized protein n=1 Tax=Aristaeella hokkaidonensis TaxID=3046382 RepID=A0AC61MUI3_9FIRM|nr:hypothetical protein [Aristaeella hokkaidonensis]QUC65949.1 hypothetical protein JYE49_08670 [Aristaeella hokkaidonensis]SNT93830.1 hypothetical protein SAMN06297421_103155 [Aristaeella hokkaidonensis]